MRQKAKISKKDQVVLKPVKSVAGSLSSYAKKKAVCFGAGREKAWEEIAEEEYGKVRQFQESGGYLPSLKRFRSSIRIKGKPLSTAVLLDRGEKR
jgi:hypothetical protein